MFFKKLDNNRLSILGKNNKKVVVNYFLNNDSYYWRGLNIVCKQYYKTKDITLHVNYKYCTDDFNVKDNYFSIYDVYDPEEKIRIDINSTNKKTNETINILSKYFKLPYCSTCHSTQGLTLD